MITFKNIKPEIATRIFSANSFQNDFEISGTAPQAWTITFDSGEGAEKFKEAYEKFGHHKVEMIGAS